MTVQRVYRTAIVQSVHFQQMILTATQNTAPFTI